MMYRPPFQQQPLDRRALGQRIFANLIPRLQSFRFQGGAPTAPRLGTPAPTGVPLQGDPRAPGPGRIGLPKGPFRPRRPGGLRPSTPTVAPPPDASRPGAGLTTGLSTPTAPPAAPMPVGPPPASKFDAEQGIGGDVSAFLRWLASLGDGGSGGAGGGAAGMGGVGSQADSGGRDSAFG